MLGAPADRYSLGVCDSLPSGALPGSPGRCYSSSAGGARQPLASAQRDRENRQTAQDNGLGRSVGHGAGRAIVDQVAVTNLAIHFGFDQD